MKLFLIKLFLSFIIGGGWVVLSTFVAEKLGTRLGGIVTGFPSTSSFGLFFIAWTQTVQFSVQATSIIPIMAAVNTVLVLILLLLLRYNVWISLLGSLIFWAITGSLFVFIKIDAFFVSILVFVVALIFSYYILEHKMRIKSTIRGDIKYNPSLVLLRGVFGGIIVSMAVIMAKFGGPWLGGLFSMFPALFLSTFSISYFTHGTEFAKALMKTAVFGAINVLIYAILVRYLYPIFGLWKGTLLCIIGSVIGAYLIYKLLIVRMI